MYIFLTLEFTLLEKFYLLTTSVYKMPKIIPTGNYMHCLFLFLFSFLLRYGAPSKPPGSKLKNQIASETFIYGGRTVSTYAPPPRQEKVTLKSLASKGVSSEHLDAWKGKQKEKLKTDGGTAINDAYYRPRINLGMKRARLCLAFNVTMFSRASRPVCRTPRPA